MTGSPEANGAISTFSRFLKKMKSIEERYEELTSYDNSIKEVRDLNIRFNNVWVIEVTEKIKVMGRRVGKVKLKDHTMTIYDRKGYEITSINFEFFCIDRELPALASKDMGKLLDYLMRYAESVDEELSSMVSKINQLRDMIHLIFK